MCVQLTEVLRQAQDDYKKATPSTPHIHRPNLQWDSFLPLPYAVAIGCRI